MFIIKYIIYSMTMILFVLQHDASNTIRALHKLLSVTKNKINKIRKMVKLELAEEIEKDVIRLVTSVIHVALRCSTTEPHTLW